MNLIKGQSVSKKVFYLLCLVMVVCRFMLPRFDTHDVLSILSWDIFGYYLYLPATFIHHDLGLRNFLWVQQVLDNYHPTIGFYQAYMGPAGDYVMKYPMGLAILYFPFFAIGHLAAHIFGYAADGFTMPYQVSIAFGSIIYALAGLWFLRKVLRCFFSDMVVAICMIIIVFGTNYMHLTAFDGVMPHNYLFTLYAMITWYTIRWHDNQRWKYALAIGLLCGLATLVRPTAGVIVLVPVLWGVWGSPEWKKKWRLVTGNYLQVVLMVVTFCLVVGLQLLYWKAHTGKWIYYSYEKGEQLEWIAPYLGKVLFSYRKGWLLYTPVMVFALAGFLPLAIKYRRIFTAVFVFFLVNLLLVSSWPTWWYGGSFGQRALMESYMILAFPLCTFLEWVTGKNKVLQGLFFTTILLLAALNLFQTWQYYNYILDSSGMTKGYYWRIFGKTSVKDADRRYLVPSLDNEEKEGLPAAEKFTSRVLASYDFEHPSKEELAGFCRDTANSGTYSIRMNQDRAFSPGINIAYKELSKRDFAWIQACGYIYFTCKPEEVVCGLVVTCNQDGKSYKYRILPLEKASLKPFTWNKVCLDYKTPYLEDQSGTVQVYFWWHGEKEVLVDDIEVKLFEFD
ncbi:MAG: glycosyltransferase family 39 protein [Bacteroidetes bacterium]|nr:glycosyltransferase family 39 protein [Bacteroidota bacterium]